MPETHRCSERYRAVHLCHDPHGTCRQDAVAVEQAVLELDGRTRTQLSLEAPDGTVLAVAGGPALFLAQFLLPEDGGEWLVRGTGEGEVELGIGGQAASWPCASLVAADRALEAMRWFLRHGDREPGLSWQRSW